jgi:hypothetical protein
MEIMFFIRKEAVKLAVALIMTTFLFLTVGQTVTMPPEQCRDCFITKGLPSTYELSGGFSGQTQFLLPFFLLDIFVWFCLSLLIVYVFEFVRNKITKRGKS